MRQDTNPNNNRICSYRIDQLKITTLRYKCKTQDDVRDIRDFRPTVVLCQIFFLYYFSNSTMPTINQLIKK